MRILIFKVDRVTMPQSLASDTVENHNLWHGDTINFENDDSPVLLFHV